MRLEIFRRLLLILSFAIWFGGFTFYAEVVIPTGHQVYHSEMKVGLLTQQVTRWLNIIALFPMLVMLWNCAATWRWTKGWRRGLIASCAALIVVGGGLLFLVHPVMDRYISIESTEVLDEKIFTRWHIVYETIATIQWLATIVYFWNTLLVWKTMDATTCLEAPGSK